MMSISEPYKTLLTDEIKIICNKIKEEPDPRKKLYYYSAAHSAIQRIFNLDPKFDPQLVFIHTVLSFSHTQIHQRLINIISGDSVVVFPTDFFDRLTTCLDQLESNIRNNEDPYIVLEKIIVLTYITSGNGYYLYKIGKLKLP